MSKDEYRKPSGWSEMLGECDDDYCTGCEPGCTLEDVRFEGPMLPDHYNVSEFERFLIERYSRTDIREWTWLAFFQLPEWSNMKKESP